MGEERHCSSVVVVRCKLYICALLNATATDGVETEMKDSDWNRTRLTSGRGKEIPPPTSIIIHIVYSSGWAHYFVMLEFCCWNSKVFV